MESVMKNLFVSLVLALFLVPLSLSAQTGTWTAVASSGDIDETALGIFSVNGANLQHLGASINQIVARYNVTNTFGGGVSDLPPWSTLELGYFDNTVNGGVRATLFQVDPCTGNLVALCTVGSQDAAAATCNKCSFTQQVDFGKFLYYVEVTIFRNVGNVFPAARTLRIF
jgi:hypothetical protein